jgi:hypothetical protein
MPDISGFAYQDNAPQRNVEKREDQFKLFKEAFFDSDLMKTIGGGSFDTEHSGDILLEAHDALLRNDLQGAAHQLRRELDFCKAIPELINSPYAISAKAGLNAINEHKSAADMRHAMQEVWLKAWAEHPTFFNEVDP